MQPATPRNLRRINRELPRGMSGDDNQEHSSVYIYVYICVDVAAFAERQRDDDLRSGIESPSGFWTTQSLPLAVKTSDQ